MDRFHMNCMHTFFFFCPRQQVESFPLPKHLKLQCLDRHYKKRLSSLFHKNWPVRRPGNEASLGTWLEEENMHLQ